MKISDVRIRQVEKDDSKLKAIASITIDDCFVVHDIKIIEGKDSLFIAMPSKKLGKGEFRDIAHPLSSTTREKIKTAVFAEYNRVKEILEANPEMELSDVYKEE